MTTSEAHGASTTTVDPVDEPAATASLDRAPRPVLLAFSFFLAALAIKVVRGTLAVVLPPSTQEYADFIQGLQVPTDPAGAQSAAGAGHTAAVVNLVLAVVFAAAFLLVGRTMLRGSRWARLVVAVFAVLGVLDGLAFLITRVAVAPVPVAGGAVGIVLLVLLVVSLLVSLVNTFRPASNRFFAATAR